MKISIEQVNNGFLVTEHDSEMPESYVVEFNNSDSKEFNSSLDLMRLIYELYHTHDKHATDNKNIYFVLGPGYKNGGVEVACLRELISIYKDVLSYMGPKDVVFQQYQERLDILKGWLKEEESEDAVQKTD